MMDAEEAESQAERMPRGEVEIFNRARYVTRAQLPVPTLSWRIGGINVHREVAIIT